MIVIRNGVEDNTLDIIIGNEKINRVDSVKYLGVVIDKKLTFNELANICIKKSASKTNLLYRISKKLTFPTKKFMFYSIVLPNFQYYSTLYFICKKEDIMRMQKIQNRAMRIILNCEYRTHIEWMLQTPNWLSINQMIKFIHINEPWFIAKIFK